MIDRVLAGFKASRSGGARKSLGGVVAAAALAIAGSNPAQGGGEPFYHQGHWGVIEGERSCWLIGGFEENLRMLIQHDVARNAAVMVIASERFSSVRQGDSFTLDLHFLKGGEYIVSYQDLNFLGNRLISTPSVMHIFEGRKFLEEFASADHSVVNFQDLTILASLELRGAADAVVALKRCARIEAGFDPDDPFADVPRN